MAKRLAEKPEPFVDSEPAKSVTDAADRAPRRSGRAGDDAVDNKARIDAVMEAAERSGLLKEKSGRISGRVSPALIRQAKRQTGIGSDTDLIEFALAAVALEDSFAETFTRSRGKVDPALKLGF